MAKIAVTTSWSPFQGFSLLFEGANEQFVRAGALWKLAGHAPVPFLNSFSRAVYEVLREALPTNTFAYLPAESYHVTVWDGLNAGNVSTITDPARRGLLTKLINDLPSSQGWLESETHFPSEASLCAMLSPQRVIRFCFSDLYIWNDQVLVAALKEESGAALEAVERARKALNAELRKQGPSPFEDYTPHISIGYFTHPLVAQGVAGQKSRWSTRFAQLLKGHSLEFRGITRYYFSDMSTFLKV